MKKILAIITAVAASCVGFFIAKGLGQAIIEIMNETGGMVTASDILGLRYVLPAVVAIMFGYFCYWLVNET